MCVSLYCVIYISCDNGVTDTNDDVIKWKPFPRNWPFLRGIHRSPVNSSHKGQWRGALMFSLICVWINDWVNNREAGDLRRYRPYYDVIEMCGRDDVIITWKGIPHYCSFLCGIPRSLLDSPHRVTLTCSFNIFIYICLIKHLNKK